MLVAHYNYTLYKADTFKDIQQTKTLSIITDNNINTYYIYKDAQMGFEYDLAKAFADSLGVELKIKTPGWNNMFTILNSGMGNVIAANLTITKSRKKHVDFSDSYLSIQQKIIIHKNNRTIKTLDDLNGRDVHVLAGTSYHERLLELNRWEGMDIHIVVSRNLATEELIRKVAEKEIEITVSDSNIALLNRRYYPDIRIAFPIEEEQRLAWAVKKKDKHLKAAINLFLREIKENGQFEKIYERYYADVENFDYVDLKKFHKRILTRLPKYRGMIQAEAARYDLDWRLITALIYQESHFNPRARSHTGVRGLMQLTLPTAKEMGVKNRIDPGQSIQGGIKYFNKLFKRLDDVPNRWDRLLFTVAAYNIGYGHLRDAQSIARQKGLDPQKWDQLKQVLPLLHQRVYYKKTRYGYARGREAVQYVSRIITYYDILKQKAHAARLPDLMEMNSIEN